MPSIFIRQACDALYILLRDFDVPSDWDTKQDRLLQQITKLTDKQILALISFLETLAK